MLTTVYSDLYTYQLTQGSYRQALIINPKERHKDFSNGIFVDWYRPDNVSRLLLKGSAPCGEPNIGDLENDQYFPMLESLLSSGEHFVVRAKGDSMIGAGIDDGDYVIVEASPVAENGKIVIAMIDGEITIKRFSQIVK